MTSCKRHEWTPVLPRVPWPPGRAEFDAVTAECCSRCNMVQELSGQRFAWVHRLTGDWRGADLTRATFPIFDARDADLTGADSTCAPTGEDSSYTMCVWTKPTCVT